ncbi:hypothetical protein ACVWYQ_000556 [Bradyrhizobium sp. USDA 3397]
MDLISLRSSADSETGFSSPKVFEKSFAMCIFSSRARCAAGHNQASRPFLYVLASILSAACVISFASAASAQCAARDVLQNKLKLALGPGVATAY